MTNGDDREAGDGAELLACFDTLRRLAHDAGSPGVRAAARAAAAEVHAALDGEALHVAYYSQEWIDLGGTTQR